MQKAQLIRHRLKTNQSSRKSHVDVRTRELDFKVNDWDFQKVSPIK